MKKLDAKAISGAMAAETALSRREAEDLTEQAEQLPDDHPLKGEIERQQQLLGDLALLPANHPVRVAMEEARLRYEAEQSAATESAEFEAEQEEQAQRAKLRHAKKLDAKREAAEVRRREEERGEKRRASVQTVNSSISETLDAVQRLLHNIDASREDFAGDHYAEMKLERLSRVAAAAARGISQSKLNAGRMVIDNG